MSHLSPRLRRLGLSALAAVGSLLVFVAAAYVGVAHTDVARLTRLQAAAAVSNRPAPAAVLSAGAGVSASPTPVPPNTTGRHILSGSIIGLDSSHLFVRAQGLVWEVTVTPRAMIKLSGKTSTAESLQVGDRVVLLGQSGTNATFRASAITARPPAATPASASSPAPSPTPAS